MLTLTSNIRILFCFVILIGYSHQFENLIRKINDFYHCRRLVNPPIPVSQLMSCSSSHRHICRSVSIPQIDVHLQSWQRHLLSMSSDAKCVLLSLIHPCCSASKATPKICQHRSPQTHPPLLRCSEAY